MEKINDKEYALTAQTEAEHAVHGCYGCAFPFMGEECRRMGGCLSNFDMVYKEKYEQ